MNPDELVCRIQSLKSRNEIPQVLVEFGLNEKICEVGVQNAKNMLVLLQAVPKEVWAVDVWENQGIYRNALDRISQYPGMKMLKMDSMEGAAKAEDGYFDYIYIDADHSYRAVKKDLEAWYPKLKVGGLFAGHDYFEHAPGVAQAVHEFVEEKQIPFSLTDEDCSSWLIVKE